MVASMKLLHWYNKTRGSRTTESECVVPETWGGLAVVAEISGWKYVHHLGKIEEKNKDGEIALCINDFRERKGMVCVR